jgi:dTDP-4-dehydrorhamnose 3,5-epimerase
MNEPVFIGGGCHIDERGVVSFCNNFKFPDIKRFYILNNFQVGYVRAWHGRKKERKYIVLVHGSAMVCCAPLEVFTKIEGDRVHVYRFILSDKQPGVLYIPEGYANGFKALEPDTHIIHFSTMLLDDTKDDDVRFPADFLAGVW